MITIERDVNGEWIMSDGRRTVESAIAENNARWDEELVRGLARRSSRYPRD